MHLPSTQILPLFPAVLVRIEFDNDDIFTLVPLLHSEKEVGKRPAADTDIPIKCGNTEGAGIKQISSKHGRTIRNIVGRIPATRFGDPNIRGNFLSIQFVDET
jgi:hypothetical protein